MKRAQKVMITSVVSAMLLGGTLYAQSVFAASKSVPSLASEIANKFGLKQADVQAIIDQHKQEVESKRQAVLEDRLNQAVTDGKLTAAQKDAITIELGVVKQQMESIRQMTDAAARRTAMKQLQTDIKTWADQNNIGSQWLRPFEGPGGGR